MFELKSQRRWQSCLEQADSLQRPGVNSILPLLQDWNYGEALIQTQGRNVRRFVVEEAGTPLALLQCTRFKNTLPTINQGPLWLTLDPQKQMRVAQKIRKQFAFLLWRASINTDVKILPWALKLDRNPWQSAWLDLSLSQDQIIQGLESKWRNQLKQSEKWNFISEISNANTEDWGWFQGQIQELATQKKFVGHDPKLLDFYRSQSSEHLCLIHKSGGQSLAGLFFVRHHKTWTYLAGVNTSEGRKHQAHNRMMIEAILQMQKMGAWHLDLGGLDFKNTPGVAHFKSGLGGTLYKLSPDSLYLWPW